MERIEFSEEEQEKCIFDLVLQMKALSNVHNVLEKIIKDGNIKQIFSMVNDLLSKERQFAFDQLHEISKKNSWNLSHQIKSNMQIFKDNLLVIMNQVIEFIFNFQFNEQKIKRFISSQKYIVEKIEEEDPSISSSIMASHQDLQQSIRQTEISLKKGPQTVKKKQKTLKKTHISPSFNKLAGKRNVFSSTKKQKSIDQIPSSLLYKSSSNLRKSLIPFSDLSLNIYPKTIKNSMKQMHFMRKKENMAPPKDCFIKRIDQKFLKIDS